MKNIGVGLSIFGILLTLLLMVGVKFPVLENNLIMTKNVFEKIKSIKGNNLDQRSTLEYTSEKEDLIHHEKENTYRNSGNESSVKLNHNENINNKKDYIVGSDGKIYENKPCFNCFGEGFIFGINPATNKKIVEICTACDGVGKIGY